MATKPGIGNIYNDSSVDVKPNGPTLRQRHQIRLWFVGYDLLTSQGFSPVVEVKGKAIQMPQIGHALKVDNVVAKDLIFKTQTVGRNGQIKVNLLTDEQGGEEIAASLRAAADAGLDYRSVDMSRIQARHLAVSLTDADLIETLRQRNIAIPQELLDRANAEADQQSENGQKTGKSKSKKGQIHDFEPDKPEEGD